MKTVLNKEIELKVKPEGKSYYSDLIKMCVNKQKDDGFTVDEMRKRFRILDIIDKGGKNLNFEDQDFKLLKTLLNEMKWPIINKEILEFTDYILILE